VVLLLLLALVAVQATPSEHQHHRRRHLRASLSLPPTPVDTETTSQTSADGADNAAVTPAVTGAVTTASVASSNSVRLAVQGSANPTTAFGAVASAVFYDTCYLNDWSTLFDFTVNATVVPGTLMTALERVGQARAPEHPGVNKLNEVQSCGVKNMMLEDDFITVDWFRSLGHTGWSLCPEGHYLSGLDRRVHGYRDFLTYIEYGRCTAIETEFSSGWDIDSCVDVDVSTEFETPGWISCPVDTYIVGFYRGTQQYLNGLQRLRCCSPLVCNVGWYSRHRYCSECPAGKYTSSTCQYTCNRCEANTYSSSMGSTSCTACGSGKYTHGLTGASYCW